MPTAVHLDHGSTLETIKLALKLGFTSVMFDGSKYPLEENIKRTREVVKLAHAQGAAVEAEIGRVGGAEGDYKSVDVLVTSVDEAKRFAEETEVDALAVAIGTAHGNYTVNKIAIMSESRYTVQPQLRIDRLKEIFDAVQTPLVLHGGTGLTENDFRNCIANGIKKINIATASYDNSAKKIREVCDKNPQAKFFDFSNAIVQGTRENVKRHMKIFNPERR